MNILLRRALVVAALFGVVGCSGGLISQPSSFSSQAASAVLHPGVPFASQILHSAVRREPGSGKYPTKKSLVFESDQAEVAVNIYQTADLAKNPAPIASIHVAKGCPYGLAADKKGTIYVADNCGLGSFVGDIEEYPKGSTKLKTTITDGINDPSGIAIDKSGTLYVSSDSTASISEYPAGTTSPSKVITGGGMREPFGLALDSSGNLYIADFSASAVFELPAGGSSVTNLGLQDLGEPTYLTVNDKLGYLWETGGALGTISVYQLGGSAYPIETLSGTGSAYPYAISLENKGKPKGEVVESDVDTGAVYAFKPGSYTPYATLTNGVELPTGLLITRP